jgi:hypothetical protein
VRTSDWADGWARLEAYFETPFGEPRERAAARAKVYREQLEHVTPKQWRLAVDEAIATLPRDKWPSVALLRGLAGAGPKGSRKQPEVASAAPEHFRREYEAKYGPQYYVDAADLQHGVTPEPTRHPRSPKAEADFLEAVAHDYPLRPGENVLDHIERIAVLAGLMKPIRLADWTPEELKSGRRNGDTQQAVIRVDGPEPAGAVLANARLPYKDPE